MNYLKEKTGKESSTRLAMFAIVLTALYIAIYQTIKSPEHTFDLPAVITLLMTGLGAKLYQKGQEEPKPIEKT